MRTFDLTNGKQFPETLHVHKNILYPYYARFGVIHRLSALREFRGIGWFHVLRKFVDSFQNQQIVKMQYPVIADFIDFVRERVPIYFVNKNQIGATIDVQETAYSMYETVVPDNHITVPLISKDELGRSYNNWEECFQPYIAREAEERRPYYDEYPFDQEIFPDLCESDATMIEIEAEALYCPTGGDPECQESNPEIFIYMDYFVDSNGNPTRPSEYIAYVIVHELVHAMMDERLWEAFLCKNGHTLSKGIPHNSKRYYLLEEGLATAIGWHSVRRDVKVAQEIMKAGLPYSFGLSPYYHNCHTRFRVIPKRISEWLSAKMHDPTPYL